MPDLGTKAVDTIQLEMKSGGSCYTTVPDDNFLF